jgi:hypothetical protein
MMLNRHAKDLFRRALAALLLAGAAACAWATPIGSSYHVELDTRAYSGTGWLDLQFNPGMDGASQATATIRNFTGLPEGEFFADGEVTGTLPGVVAIGNGSAFNALFSSIGLGTRFGFDLSFSSGATGSAPADSVFSVALYGDDQVTQLGHPDPFLGSLLRFEVSAAGVAPVPSDDELAGVSAVPEPGTLMLVLPALALLGAARRQRR